MSVERQLNFDTKPEALASPSLEILEQARDIPRGAPETFGATPLDHASAYDQQCVLLDAMGELLKTDIPSDIPEEIVKYMEDTFSARFHSRGTANHENYLTALHAEDEFQSTPVTMEMIERAKLGHASPAELLLVRETLGIRSAELACLTHPYGKRIEYIDVMRDSVRQSVELLGGSYYEDPETRYRIKGAVNERYWEANYSEGFFMTRKRDLGLMPDGTVIRERTSFILRSDENGALPSSNLEAIRSLDIKDKTWQDDAVRIGHLDQIAAGLLEADEFSLVIPVSTTIYAFNPETASEIETVQQEKREQRRVALQHDIQARFPALFAHMQEARVAREVPRGENIGDMLFVPPEHLDDTK